MTPEEWISAAEKISEMQGAATSSAPPTLRAHLIELDSLLRAAPLTLRDDYRRIPENRLAGAACKKLDAIAGGSLAWGPVEGEDWLLATGAQARALDRELADASLIRPGTPASSADWLAPGGNAYVVPRPIPRPKPLESGLHDYARRGLLHHRIIPARIEHLRIEICTASRLSRGSWTGRPLGAALFVGFELEMKAQNGRFIASGIVCEGAMDTVGQQLEQAAEGDCIAVVWPELTVPPELRRTIQDRLRARPLSDNRGPLLAVAGTWHESVGDLHVNIGTVLDANGEPLLRFEKIIPFGDKDAGNEAIRPAESLHLLWTGDGLMAFAICKDFCEQQLASPFEALDVDLVLVPSMGEASTMQSHLQNADRLRKRIEARAFVVQQSLLRKDGELGFVLGPRRGFDELRASDLRCYDIMSLHHPK